MPGHCRPQALELPAIEAHEGGAVRVRLGLDHVRLYPSVARGAATVGLPVCVRPPPEHSLYLRTAGDHEGNAVDKPEVRVHSSINGKPILTEVIRSPTKLLRSFPPLQAKLIVEITVSNLRKIPADIYEELVHHAE